ncbi:hypothetical protein ABPG74_000515 [Tetrahymena malaccensis]
MSKKRSGNSRVSYHLKNSGYFMEEAFNCSEYELVKNDSLELNTQNQHKFYLKPQLNNLIQINNSTLSNTTNRKKQQSSYLSPRLLTASTTTQRSSFNNSNMLQTTQNSQNLCINHALQNSYQNKNRSLKQSLHEKVNKKPSKSVYNSNYNILLDDISTKINQSDIYNKKERDTQIFVTSVNSERSEKIGKSKEITKNIFQTTQDNSSDIIIESLPNTQQFSLYKSFLSTKYESTLQNQNFNDESKLPSEQTENKQLSRPHNLLINNYAHQKQPILSKIFSSQANLKAKSQVYQQYQNLPITSRLQLLVNNKVQQKFLENTQNENNTTVDVSQIIQAKSQRDLSVNPKDEKPNQTEISIASPQDSKKKIQLEQKKTSQLNYQILVEKENIFANVNFLFQYFLNEYKRVSNMYKLSSTYRQGIQNLYQAHANCTSKLLSHIQKWQEIKKNKNESENSKTQNLVEEAADSLAIDVFLSKNPMQIMSVSLACAKIYINLKKPIKAIPILKQCKRLSDLYRNQTYKMKCYRALSECFIMIRKEIIAEKFVKKYLQLSWCNKSDKNELQAYDMLGLISYYNGDIERAKFYHHRMANNILEDESSQLRKISILNQVTKQKRRDEKMKDENPPINKKVEGDENMFIDSSDEENEEILLVPEPNQQNKLDEENSKFEGNLNRRHFIERYSDNSKQSKQHNDLEKISPQAYLTSKQGFDLRKQPFKTQLDYHSTARIINEANQRIRQPKKIFKFITTDRIPAPINNQKTDFGPLKPPIIISHLSRNRALLNFQKFELQNKIDASAQMDINYWEPYDLKKAENILLRLQKVLQYFKHILEDFSNDMNSNILIPDERNKYFSDKQFSIKHYLYKLLSQNNLLQLKTSTSASSSTQETNNSQTQLPGSQLKALIVFTRHGARTPANEDYYKEEWDGLKKGDLTERGIRQLQNLGQSFRKLYPNFFKNEWDSQFQRVKYALFLQRTMLSMLSFFHGLFPDLYNNKSLLTHKELYEPIKELGIDIGYPSNPRDLIFRAISRVNCKLGDDLLRQYSNGKKFMAIQNRYLDDPLMVSIKQKLLDYRGNPNEDLEFKDMYHVKEIYDSFLCNKNGGKKIPNFDDKELELLKQLYEMFFFRFYGVRKHRLIFNSAYYREVLNFVEDLRFGRTPNRFFFFSGTKTNIAIILSSLLSKGQIINLGDNKIAHLSTTFVIEVYQMQNDGSISLIEGTPANPIPKEQLYVSIKYANTPLPLKQCKERVRCTYKEFIILLKTRIIKNLEKVCDNSFYPFKQQKS